MNAPLFHPPISRYHAFGRAAAIARAILARRPQLANAAICLCGLLFFAFQVISFSQPSSDSAAAPALPSAAWSFLSTDAPERVWCSMVYDSARDRCVLFGGAGLWSMDPAYYYKIAEFDGREWAYRTAEGPKSRVYSAMAFDSRRGRTVLYGGFVTPLDAKAGEETWEWDGTSWREIQVRGPGSRQGHVMAYDEIKQKIVLFGGCDTADTWEYDGTKWERAAVVGPPPRYYSAMAYDSVRKRMVLFGGNLTGSVDKDNCNDTWEWNGAKWISMKTAQAPSVRHGHAMAFFPPRKRVVLMGGTTEIVKVALKDAWEWDGARWTQLDQTDHPRGRFGHCMAYDANRQRIVLAAGANGWVYIGGQLRWNTLGDLCQYACVQGPVPTPTPVPSAASVEIERIRMDTPKLSDLRCAFESPEFSLGDRPLRLRGEFLKADASGVSGNLTVEGFPQGASTMVPLTGAKVTWDSKRLKITIRASAAGKSAAKKETFKITLTGERDNQSLLLNAACVFKLASPSLKGLQKKSLSFSAPLFQPNTSALLECLDFKQKNSSGKIWESASFCLDLPWGSRVEGKAAETRTQSGSGQNALIKRLYTFKSSSSRAGTLTLKTGAAPPASPPDILSAAMTLYGVRLDKSDMQIEWSAPTISSMADALSASPSSSSDSPRMDSLSIPCESSPTPTPTLTYLPAP